MEGQGQALRRRINTISGHLVTGIVTEDATHLLPLNCSSQLSTPFRRLDSRVCFGRQASAAQGYFMRQQLPSSIEQENSAHGPRGCSADSISEEKSVAANPPMFSRPATGGPLFSRPVETEYNCSNAGVIESVITQDKKLSALADCPKFSKPSRAVCQVNHISSVTQTFTSQNGNKWSPRVNVAESKSNHAITVELPGVDIRNIRVEMDDKSIIVRGRRSINWWREAGCRNNSLPTYHKMEIMQGTCQVILPLPACANKDAVSAELVEGILQITIPKL